MFPLPDSVKDVAHLPENHLQAAEGRRDSEPGRRVGDGVSTEPGLHGNKTNRRTTDREMINIRQLHFRTFNSCSNHIWCFLMGLFLLFCREAATSMRA